MNILIEKEFSEAVHTVARFAERKSTTLPALSSILIIAGDDGIKLRATNLETGIDLKLSGEVITDGVVAIPAILLQQIAGSFTQEGKVSLEHTGDIVSITSGTGKVLSKQSLMMISHQFLFGKSKNRIVIPGVILKIFYHHSVMRLYFNYSPRTCKYISLDRRRVFDGRCNGLISSRRKKFPSPTKERKKVLIPAKTP